MARLRTAERQLPPAPAARMNAAARVSCGFLFLTRSLGSPARLLSLRSVSPARQLSLSLRAPISSVRSRSLFPFFAPILLRFPTVQSRGFLVWRPPCAIWRDLDAKATFFGRLGCKADATRI